MLKNRAKCWLQDDQGTRIRLSSAGVLIGREGDCDLVLTDPRASRRHALVRVALDGPEVLPMGRNPTEVNGQLISSTTALKDGDRLSFPGLEFSVGMETETSGSTDHTVAWILEREKGGRYGIAHSPYAIGGGADDDLVLEGLPPHALRFLVAQNALFVELGASGTVNENPCPAGHLEGLAEDNQITVEGERFTVMVIKTSSEKETFVPQATTPRAVRLQFLPRGGRLFLIFEQNDVSTYLADRRCDLVAGLLHPHKDYQPGSFIPDEILIPRIWPRQPKRGRGDVNTLVYRVRQDLVRSGLNGVMLIERAPGGGATRFVLGPGTKIEIA